MGLKIELGDIVGLEQSSSYFKELNENVNNFGETVKLAMKKSPLRKVNDINMKIPNMSNKDDRSER